MTHRSALPFLFCSAFADLTSIADAALAHPSDREQLSDLRELLEILRSLREKPPSKRSFHIAKQVEENAVQRRVLHSQPPIAVAAAVELSQFYSSVGWVIKAADLVGSTEAVVEYTLGPHHPLILHVHAARGRALALAGDFDGATAAYIRAIQIAEASEGDKSRYFWLLTIDRAQIAALAQDADCARFLMKRLWRVRPTGLNAMCYYAYVAMLYELVLVRTSETFESAWRRCIDVFQQLVAGAEVPMRSLGLAWTLVSADFFLLQKDFASALVLADAAISLAGKLPYGNIGLAMSLDRRAIALLGIKSGLRWRWTKWRAATHRRRLLAQNKNVAHRMAQYFYNP